MSKLLLIVTVVFCSAAQAQNCMELFSDPLPGYLFEKALQNDEALVSQLNALVDKGLLVQRARTSGEDLAYVQVEFGNDQPVVYQGLFINEPAIKYPSQLKELTRYLVRINKILELEAQGAVFTIDSLAYPSTTITITKINSTGKATDPTLKWMKRYPSTQFIFQGSDYWWNKYALGQFVNLNGNDLTMRYTFFEDKTTWDRLPQIVHNSGMTYQ